MVRTTVTAIDRRPITLRVRAINAAGPGPFSPWTSAVPSFCSDTEFLADHLPARERICKPCSTRAAKCDGGSTFSLTAAPGYQRLPWVPGRAAFAECPRPQSCLTLPLDAEGRPVLENTITRQNGSTSHRLSARGLLERDAAGRLSARGLLERDAAGSLISDILSSKLRVFQETEVLYSTESPPVSVSLQHVAGLMYLAESAGPRASAESGGNVSVLNEGT